MNHKKKELINHAPKITNKVIGWRGSRANEVPPQQWRKKYRDYWWIQAGKWCRWAGSGSVMAEIHLGAKFRKIHTVDYYYPWGC